MATAGVINIESDNLIAITVKDEDGVAINTATVTATLKDSAGVDVTGVVDVSFVYKTASEGIYEYTIPNTITLVENSDYYFYVKIVADGKQLMDKYRWRAEYHGGEYVN